MRYVYWIGGLLVLFLLVMLGGFVGEELVAQERSKIPVKTIPVPYAWSPQGISDVPQLKVEITAWRIADRERERYVTVSLVFQNESDTRALDAFTGRLVWRDSFDREITSVEFTVDVPLDPTSTTVQDLHTPYRAFLDDQEPDKRPRFDQMKLVFEVEAITYSDGTVRRFKPRPPAHDHPMERKSNDERAQPSTCEESYDGPNMDRSQRPDLGALASPPAGASDGWRRVSAPGTGRRSSVDQVYKFREPC